MSRHEDKCVQFHVDVLLSAADDADDDVVDLLAGAKKQSAVDGTGSNFEHLAWVRAATWTHGNSPRGGLG